MDKGLETCLDALKRDVQAVVLASAAAKLVASRGTSEADLKDIAKRCGLQPAFFVRCVRRAAKVGGRKKPAKMSMLDVKVREDIYKHLVVQCQKREWDFSGYIRSLLFFYLSDTKEPPPLKLSRKSGRLAPGETRMTAERLHVRIPSAMRTALSMRATARKTTVRRLVLSLVAMASTGNWEQPPRLMEYKDCSVPIDSFFLPKALVADVPSSVEP